MSENNDQKKPIDWRWVKALAQLGIAFSRLYGDEERARMLEGFLPDIEALTMREDDA